MLCLRVYYVYVYIFIYRFVYMDAYIQFTYMEINVRRSRALFQVALSQIYPKNAIKIIDL